MKKPLALGTKTKWGEIVGIRTEGGPLGERYYFITKGRDVSFMPANVVEALSLPAVQALKEPR